ncbi:HDIG domain-containing metalloprotein [Nitratifractor salsuginis]|uniref:Metal dependent phosphohydrolase n=1 Tax=Nitratifractor salsuginis (strain DSM 16511 / JCM 12458 / E9I37-1) TaxID=749222 RepID=E6X2R9_NITSE|nr:HDIG domain-containing metalloprotein [Nitratifractor salsuginis]ADV46135.1 metal dependent phosphohydrolase [Nitratifractor salsuginis DSM 16511]
MPSRDEALELLKEYNDNPALVQHGIQVGACMAHFAQKAGEDAERWEIAGLLHDLDYEKYPDRHCHKAAEIMRERGYDEELIRAMMSHAWGICTDVEPLSPMEKTLYAVDELSGLVNACVLVRPSKSIEDLGVKSVKKKFKQKSFAAGVDREIVKKGAEMLGMELDELIAEVIEAMKARAKECGVAGAA